MTYNAWIDGGALSAGLLAVRVILGLGFAAHGAQKLFGWFGGHGLAGTGGYFEGIGLRPGTLFAGLAGLAEMGGGLLVAAGLFGPIGPALVVANMVVAARVGHAGKGFFASNGGYELALVYGTGIAALAFTGFGAYSLDNWLGLASMWTPERGWLALALAMIAGSAMSLLPRKASPPPAAS